jgi:bacillithiol system protein YtxJ
MNWNTIQTEADLDQIDKDSFSSPQLIFKHSTRCSISSAALDRMERLWPKDQVFRTHFLDLLSYRPISNAISHRYQVEHESPQALLIVNGKCLLHQSHLQIQPLALSAAKPSGL